MSVTKINLPDLKQKLMQKPHLALLPLFVVLVLVFVVYTLLVVSPTSSPELSPADIQPVSQANHVISFSPNINTWKEGSTYNLNVAFDQMPANAPTTVGFSVQYDPSVFEIVDVKAGDLWTKATFLEKNIQEGKVNVTIAQSLDGQISSAANPYVATIIFRVHENITTDSSVISFGPEGTLGSVDLDHLEAIVGVPTRILLQH